MAKVNRRRTSSSVKRQQMIQIARDIKITREQHTKLVDYIVGRLDLAKKIRDQQAQFWSFIDQEYYTYLKLDADDMRRQRDNIQAKGLKPVDVKLPMVFAQLDEAETFLLTLLAPDEAIYSAMAPKEQQPVADGFAALMNDHAQTFHHYRHYSLFIKSCMRYNLGGYVVLWREIKGNMVRNDNQNNPIVTRDVVKTGNEVLALDPYQLFLDGSVEPTDVASNGEYFGYVELYTPFRIKKMAEDGDLYNVGDLLSGAGSTSGASQPFRWYRKHPIIRDNYDLQNTNTPPDWISVFSQGSNSATSDSDNLRELVPFYCWIIPANFGLSPSTNYEIWRFTLGADQYICNAEHLVNSHAMLPINIAIPFEDHFGLQSKGAAERLIPYQVFASFVMNSHQRATRKKLYGLTIFNENVIPLLANTDIDMEGGKVAATTQSIDTDLRKHIVQFTDGPDTTGTLQNIKLMNDLMQQILPTTVLQQVAGLERATQYQAAALVQGSNKRNLRIGKVINSQSMDSGRFMQMYNIYDFQKTTQILDKDGNLVQIEPSRYRETRIEFRVADGLKGLDRLALIINMKEMFNSLLQSQQAIQQVDVLQLMNYLSSLFGDFTDFSQFKLQSPIDTLPADQRDLAFRLLQQFIQQQNSGKTGPGAATTAGQLMQAGG